MRDFSTMLVSELQAGLRDGSIEEDELCDWPYPIGPAVRLHLAATKRALLWPDGEIFVPLFVDVLRKAGNPPRLGLAASLLGCDPKTVLKHTERHLGAATWQAVLAKLIAGEIPGWDPPGSSQPPLRLE